MSKDIPIIFSAPMVRALLEGRKTMTRRLARTSRLLSEESSPGKYHSRSKIMDSPWKRTKVGDRLWVRENFAYVGSCDPGFLTYQATYPRDLAKYGCENVPATVKEAGYKWTPCIHMPRALSRLTLVVTGVKVEPLWSISPRDAEAEGVVFESADPPFFYVPGIMPHSVTAVGIEERGDLMPHDVQCFRKLWIYINGRDAWETNPFVVAITFRVIKANIDAPEAKAAA